MKSAVAGDRNIEGLQVLRAVAALMVVVHHARHSVPGTEAWPTFGEVGVDIFFVISGFVMAHTTRALALAGGIGQRLRAGEDFLRRRIVRIVPLYWLATLWTSRREIAHGAVDGNLLKDFFFLPHPNATYEGTIAPTLIQGWTLNYEMFFLPAVCGFAAVRWQEDLRPHGRVADLRLHRFCSLTGWDHAHGSGLE